MFLYIIADKTNITIDNKQIENFIRPGNSICSTIGLHTRATFSRDNVSIGTVSRTVSGRHHVTSYSFPARPYIYSGVSLYE